MKKISILFAVAALVAGAACSKVETVGTADNNGKISFQVANYANQTKANETSLAAEGFWKFNTIAVFNPTDGDVQTFMNDVEIFPFNASNAEVTSGTTGISYWSAERDYFWPKTGYINFYSYAGTKAPTSKTVADVTANSGDKKKVTFAYSDVTIAANDNLLVADAALHFNANKSTYHIDNASITGVPTLFRHLLAQVKFTVKLKTADANISANTIWKVTILNETGTNATRVSAIDFADKGTLSLVNTDALAANATLNTTLQEWTKTGWTATTGTNASRETVKLMSTDTTPAEIVLTLPVSTAEIDAVPIAYADFRSVMPQATSGVNFNLYYKIEAQRPGETTPFMTEILSVTGKTLKDLVSSIENWQMNHRYTYNIIIDPVGKKVLFDPAVEAWDTATANTASINIPLASN